MVPIRMGIYTSRGLLDSPMKTKRSSMTRDEVPAGRMPRVVVKRSDRPPDSLACMNGFDQHKVTAE